MFNFIGPNNGQGIRIYHDGKHVKSDTTKSAVSLNLSDGRINIGRTFTCDNLYNGTAVVDELLFFNKSLTEAEITMLIQYTT